LPRQKAEALLRLEIAQSDEAREAAIGGAIARKAENISCAVAKDEASADRELQAACRRLIVSRINMRTHDAGKSVAIGNADALETKLKGAGDELFRMRGATQEREIGGDGEFRERNAWPRGAHAKSPCMNQRGAAVSAP